jgi:S1-C subfamily serine protease
MGGLWIDRRGNDLVAGAVGRGSPAVRAGIRPDDGIEGIGFEALIEQMLGKPGDEVAFSVSRSGVRRDVRLVLADYL